MASEISASIAENATLIRVGSAVRGRLQGGPQALLRWWWGCVDVSAAPRLPVSPLAVSGARGTQWRTGPGEPTPHLPTGLPGSAFTRSFHDVAWSSALLSADR